MYQPSTNPNVIRTFTGIDIDPLNPQPDQINITDIAHALSYIPRFGGHSHRFYSVAEHSLHVYQQIKHDFPANLQLQLEALMHDASEAYLLDIPTPLKKRLKQYQRAEENMMKVIAEKYGFQYPPDKVVTQVDNYCLRLEWHNYMTPYSGAIMHPEPFKAIAHRFLAVFELLTNQL